MKGLKERSKEYQDSLCDCRFFGSGEEEHTETCLYLEFINDIYSVFEELKKKRIAQKSSITDDGKELFMFYKEDFEDAFK